MGSLGAGDVSRLRCRTFRRRAGELTIVLGTCIRYTWTERDSLPSVVLVGRCLLVRARVSPPMPIRLQDDSRPGVPRSLPPLLRAELVAAR